MNSGDVIGLSVLVVLALCLVYGLYRITKPVSYSKEEYEKRLKQSTGIAAGVMNAVMYPLQELWHPKAVQAIHVIKDMRQGYYDSLQESGDGVDNPELVLAQPQSKMEQVRTRPGRISRVIQRVLGVLKRH
jgi:regulatory protein YycH of two-component signal transduction system YycFG